MMNITKLNKERKDLIKRLENGLRLAQLKLGFENPKCESVNDNLYVSLSKEEEKQLMDADGNELAWKASRVNSSLCLLLNVFSGIRKGQSLDISGLGRYSNYKIEKKLQVLNGRGKKANIDMVLSNDESIVYIESKFTELFYYNKASQLSKSYFEQDKYPSQSMYIAAKQLFNLCNHYDVNQLIKHTIGIYRDCLENQESYIGKKVSLLNLIWELQNYHYRFEDSYHLQLLAIKEASSFVPMFNRLMKKVFQEIGIDFQLIYLNYHDFVYHLTNVKLLDLDLIEYLNRRYFFYHQRKIYIDDRIDYYQSHLDIDIAIDDFDDYLEEYSIIHIEDQYDLEQVDVNQAWTNISDALIIIGPRIEKHFPEFFKHLPEISYFHVCSSIFYHKYTMIYLKKDVPRLKYIVFE